jgi:hypothetical protein
VTNDDYLTVDDYYDEVVAYWIGEGLPFTAARWLALYQVTGGNCFCMATLDSNENYAERPTA